MTFAASLSGRTAPPAACPVSSNDGNGTPGVGGNGKGGNFAGANPDGGITGTGSVEAAGCEAAAAGTDAGRGAKGFIEADWKPCFDGSVSACADKNG
jgi:hypothetical protein